MTERTVIDRSLLARITKGVAAVSKELAVLSDDKGWHISTVDPSHTAMVAIEVPVSAFKEYTPFGPVCFDVSDLDVILKRGVDVTLAVSDGSLYAEAGGLSRRIPLYVQTCETRPAPSLGFGCRVTFEASAVRDAVDLFDSRRVPMARLSMTGDGFTVSAEDGADRIQAEVPRGDCLEWERPDTASAVRTSLGLEWLQSYLASVPRDELVTVSFDEDYPAQMETSCKGVAIRWICAPMVEEA